MKKFKQFLAITMASIMVISTNAFATPITLTDSDANASEIDTLDKTNGTDYFADEDTNNWSNGSITEKVRVNVARASFFNITIPKEIVLNGSTGTASYKVKAKGDIAGDQTLNVIPDTNFMLSEAGGKANVTATVTQPDTEYNYTDLQGDGTEYDGNISATLSAGEWAGKFNFNIFFNGNDEIIYKLTYTTTNNETFTINATSTNDLKQYTYNNPELKSATLELLNNNISTQNFSGLFANNENLESVDLTKVNLKNTSNTKTMFNNSTNLTSVTVNYLTVKNKETIAEDLGITNNTLTAINKTFNDYTWAEIAEISERGEASTKFSLGNIKNVEIDGKTYRFRIIGFNHDNLSDGSGKAGITLQSIDTLYDTENNRGFLMNETSTNAGGWRDSLMRNYLNNDFYQSLPTELSSHIKTVNKSTGAGGGSSSLYTTQDKIFLISNAEAGISTSWTATGEGEKYPYFTRSILNQFYDWGWLRSPCTRYYSDNTNIHRTHFIIYSKDSDSGVAATSAHVVSAKTFPVFCI